MEAQRRLIALELVMNPKNEVLDVVKQSALGPNTRNSAGPDKSKYNNQKNVNCDADKEFGNPITEENVKAANGRKCRSHRKRRSRA